MNAKLDAFTRAYLECALWSSTDDGEPLDANYGIEDLAPETIERAIKDCAKFQADHYDDLVQNQGRQGQNYLENGGHLFWLTRNHHGAGFWDGDYPDAVGERLTDASHKYREIDLYVGNDGLIYG